MQYLIYICIYHYILIIMKGEIMKNFQHTWLVKIGNLLALLLTLMGINSCNNNVVEYGAPYAHFQIKGKVMDSKGKPVSGIRVDCTINYPYGEESYTDTLATGLTNESGKFDTNFSYESISDLTVIATDIDGINNGSFEKDSVDMKITNDDYKGSKGWFEGTVTKDITITMKEK